MVHHDGGLVSILTTALEIEAIYLLEAADLRNRHLRHYMLGGRLGHFLICR